MCAKFQFKFRAFLSLHAITKLVDDEKRILVPVTSTGKAKIGDGKKEHNAYESTKETQKTNSK